MTGDEPGPDPLGEDARLQSLDRRLRDAQNDEAARTRVRGVESDAGYKLGNRVLAELLGGMIGGALIGWVIDRFAGTTPWGLLAMLALGIIVAFRNIFRLASPRK